MFTIMVNNVHDAAKAPDLKQLFGGFGEVEKVLVVEGSGPKFALVYMNRLEEARAAVLATNGHPIHQQPLRVEAYFV